MSNNELDWKTIYQLPFQVTKIDTKARQLQYKVLNRILHANNFCPSGTL